MEVEKYKLMVKCKAKVRIYGQEFIASEYVYGRDDYGKIDDFAEVISPLNTKGRPKPKRFPLRVVKKVEIGNEFKLRGE